MELDTTNSLATNETVDSLDAESDNDTHVTEPVKKDDSNTAGFGVGEQLVELPSGLKTHFTNTTSERACELVLWLNEQLSNKGKDNPGMIG